MALPSLVGLCAALLPPEHGGPDPARLAELLEGYLSRLPAPARVALRSGGAALDGLAVVTTGRRLGALTPEARERVLRRAGAARASGPALEALKAAVLLVAGADREAASTLERANASPPARPDPPLAVVPAWGFPSRARCDAVVVGSGAGGAVVARSLARAGLATVVVEEGARHGLPEFRSLHPLDRFAALYRDAGATVALGRPPVVLPIGRGVGGSTLVNSGTCYRTPDAVLRAWRDEEGLELADPEGFGAHLDRIEALLEVAPVPEAVMGRNGALALAGAAALGWRAGPLLRNAPGCGGCCQCSIGCPRNAKFGVHLNALPDACAAGARIVSEARVERVLVEADRAAGVVARRADGSRLVIAAPLVIVAAGATETPPLLRRSGLGGHPRLGRNLAVHPAVGVAGRFDEAVDAWHGVLQSAAVEEFHERGILVEATSTPPGMGSVVLPGFGRRLLEELAGARHLATLGAMVADEGAGRVLGRRRSVLRYDLQPREGRLLLEAVGVMARVLFAAGAREVLTGIPGAPPLRDPSEIGPALEAVDYRRLHVAAFHPTGTAAAGGDPERHPVGPDGRLRGVRGVVVADGSILPSCPRVNPQVSIMALASAVAERLVEAEGRAGG